MNKAHTLALVAALALLGCKKQTPESATSQPTGPQFDYVSEQTMPDGTIMVQTDTDADEKYDVWSYYLPLAEENRRLVRKEVDQNHDGEVDVRTYFDEDGNVDREEMDRDFDRAFDWTDRFADGVLVLTEINLDEKGDPDDFTYYDGNPPKVTVKKTDTNFDGRIDLWQKFDESGAVTRTGRDTDGDGKMDVREE